MYRTFSNEPAWMHSLTSVCAEAVSELDCENAHFEVCDAIIEAFEQISATHDLDSDDSEDDEISADHVRDYASSLTVPQQDDPTPNLSPISPAIVRKSASTPSFPQASESSSRISSEFDDWVSIIDTNTPSITNPLNANSISTILEKFAQHQSIEKNSPQVIARHLLSNFKFSPEESAELDWLLTDKKAQAPSPRQTLSSDSSTISNIRTIGTAEWAPPRPQIIYNLLPPTTRKAILMRCGYRCAGCGMKISPGRANLFRYCAYLGKYFCHSCHHEQLALIPARVLHKWDFRKQRVSNFAFDLLEKMFSEPLYCVVDINNSLYKNVTDMRYARALRYQLYFLHEYIKTCRNGKELLEGHSLISKHHIIDDPQLYSLKDLADVKNGSLLNDARMLVTTWLQHVDNCGLCKGKGFICELCERNEVIYPFLLDTTIQCQMCWACYHKQCWSGTCPKCARIRTRKTLSQVTTTSEEPDGNEPDEESVKC